MHDDFTHQVSPPDGTENPAIDTPIVRSNHKQVILGGYLVNTFNEEAISRLVKGNNITQRRLNKPKGDFANNDKIPFLEFRGKAIPRYF